MPRIKFSLLCLAAILVAVAVAAAEASAAPEHIYKVNGAKLEATESKEVTAKLKSGTELVIRGEREIGKIKVEWVVKCSKYKLNLAEKPAIVGGVPGTSEKEKLEPEECGATLGGVKCEKVTIEPARVKNELVTIVIPAAKAGKLATLFGAPGAPFMGMKFKCAPVGVFTEEIEGNTAALVNPEKIEALTQTLVWNRNEDIMEVERQTKGKSKVGLESSKFPVMMTGEIEVELVAKKDWGGF